MPHIDHATLKARLKSKEEMKLWLAGWKFDRFVTLTLSRPGDGVAATSYNTMTHMRDRLKQFDARMNRKLIGRGWQERPLNRMFHFFAPEKVGASPHWHGLIHFYAADAKEAARQGLVFEQNVDSIWRTLVPAGSTDVQAIENNAGAIDFVSKSLFDVLNINSFIMPDEFWTR